MTQKDTAEFRGLVGVDRQGASSESTDPLGEDGICYHVSRVRFQRDGYEILGKVIPNSEDILVAVPREFDGSNNVEGDTLIAGS